MRGIGEAERTGSPRGLFREAEQPSGGERHRMGTAVALVGDPGFPVLNERTPGREAR